MKTKVTKKISISILSLVFMTAITISCMAAPADVPDIKDAPAKNEVTVKLGDTGYSMLLTDDFERISFFDIEGEEATDNLYGIYENDKSYIIVYAGNADNTIEEEMELLLDELTSGETYATGNIDNMGTFTATGYESAAFYADIEWEDGEKENVKVLLIKCGNKGATVYYFIPQGDSDEALKREKILSGELIKK